MRPLARRIKEAGLRHQEVAALAGVSGAYVSQIIHGARMPPIHRIKRIAEILGCEPIEVYRDIRGKDRCPHCGAVHVDAERLMAG